MDASVPGVPNVKVLTGKKKGDICSMPIGRFSNMDKIAAAEVKEPPPIKRTPRTTSHTNEVGGTSKGKPKAPPPPTPKLEAGGCYQITKNWEVPAESPPLTLKKGQIVGEATKDAKKGTWGFRVLTGEGAGSRLFECKEEDMKPIAERGSPYAVAEFWVKQPQVPTWGRTEWRHALEVMVQAREAAKKVKKPTQLEAVLLNQYRNSIPTSL
jgi:hypothetical protein